MDSAETNSELLSIVQVSTEGAKRSPSPKKPNKKRRMLANLANTQYEVLTEIAKQHFRWRVTYRQESEDWDLMWTDSAVQPETLAKLKAHQRINHFPGMYMISRKNCLASHLNKMRKQCSEAYDFYPRTWLLPSEYPDLKIRSMKARNKVYIVKPEASCQGKGIYLTKCIEDFNLTDRFVIQEYIKNPLLLDGLKFDVRLYVLVSSCDPLKIYLHKEGLVRLATIPYMPPTNSNLQKQCMHLTNYAINKNSKHYVFNSDAEQDCVGHKRSLSATLLALEDEGYNVKKLWKSIKALVVKTLCAIQPRLAHLYKACQPADPAASMCFEVLGFDVMIDRNMKPWLLEVNHTPSFTLDAPIDDKVKRQVLTDSLQLVRGQIRPRKERNKPLEAVKAQQELWEAQHLGGFEKVYPCENADEYTPLLEVAKQLWEQWTGTQMSRSRVEAPDRLKLRSKSVNKHEESRRNFSAVIERLSQPPKKKEFKLPPPANIKFDYLTEAVSVTGGNRWHKFPPQCTMSKGLLLPDYPLSIRAVVANRFQLEQRLPKIDNKPKAVVYDMFSRPRANDPLNWSLRY